MAGADGALAFDPDVTSDFGRKKYHGRRFFLFFFCLSILAFSLARLRRLLFYPFPACRPAPVPEAPKSGLGWGPWQALKRA